MAKLWKNDDGQLIMLDDDLMSSNLDCCCDGDETPPDIDCFDNIVPDEITFLIDDFSGTFPEGEGVNCINPAETASACTKAGGSYTNPQNGTDVFGRGILYPPPSGSANFVCQEFFGTAGWVVSGAIRCVTIGDPSREWLRIECTTEVNQFVNTVTWYSDLFLPGTDLRGMAVEMSVVVDLGPCISGGATAIISDSGS